MALATVSVMAHGLGIALLLPHAARRAAVEQRPLVEIELVQQDAEVKGAQAPPPGQPQPAPQRPAPPPVPEGEAMPPPPPPAPEVQAAQPRPAAPTTINLGGNDRDQDPLLVTGPNVVPPRPDAQVHNKPPNYPAAAARRGAQGIVHLIVHVTEAGVPAWVDVAQSSGDPALDEAARDAVALWRFQPARQGGVAVPYDYEQNIRFTIGR